MKYELENATSLDIELLKNFKLNTLMQHADNLQEEEIDQIKAYVNKQVPIQLKEYKLIKINEKVAGCVLVTSYQQGVLLDELYIDEEYRNKGIGKAILQEIIKKNDIVYLWVYKRNKIAIDLYKRQGFVIIEETENRYFMKCSIA